MDIVDSCMSRENSGCCLKGIRERGRNRGKRRRSNRGSGSRSSREICLDCITLHLFRIRKLRNARVGERKKLDEVNEAVIRSESSLKELRLY